MLHRRTQLAQPTIGIADIVLDIGVAWVAQCGKLERRDGPIPILGAQRPLAGLEIRVELRPVGSDPIAAMVVQIGQSSNGSFASVFGSGTPSHVAKELRHGNSTATDSRLLRSARRAARPIDRTDHRRSSDIVGRRVAAYARGHLLRRCVIISAPRIALASRISCRSVSAFLVRSTSLPKYSDAFWRSPAPSAARAASPERAVSGWASA